MTDQLHETLKDIKAKFRLYMNGVVSQSMREKGLDYKLNFGIEYPRIREIAAGYEPSHELAQALWKENIRECKIMAGLLQPVDTFYREIAEMGMAAIHNSELAQYTVMNLFQHLPYAAEVVFCWIADEREYFQLCGFLLMARLLMNGMTLNDRAEAEFMDQAFTALESDSLQIRKAAALALCKFGSQSRENMKKLGKPLAVLSKSQRPGVSAIAEEIKNEAEYCR